MKQQQFLTLSLTFVILIFSNLIEAKVEAKRTLAPDFTLKSRSGKNVKLSELRSKIVLLNFWASWCGPCKAEMPKLDSIHEDYKRKGFSVLAVNLDAKQEKAITYLEKMKKPVSFPILYDPEGKIGKLYNLQSMPGTVIIDSAGNVRYLHKGYEKGDEKIYREKIDSLIKEM